MSNNNTPEDIKFYRPIPQYMPTRMDYFAAHALQGLLASGQFTDEDHDGAGTGPWLSLDKNDEYDDAGNETGRQKTSVRAAEAAWVAACFMIKNSPQADA